MPVDTTPSPRPDADGILEFARAFRSAARAVSFYPPSHQTVVSALEHVARAARTAAVDGPLCLTILPKAFLARGVSIDSSETVVADLAGLCHRHGVGALILDGRDTPDAWRGLFSLLARKPEDVRAAGGIQREWKALRHVSPALLEIDFGALLRGQVGGDFIELAGVISHYLETAGVGGSILDDPCGALRRAIEHAPDEAAAVAAVIRELRAAAQLTWTQPDQFDDVFRRAAAVGEFLTEGLMAGLLERRRTADAMVATVDVVSALVDRMSDATVSAFLTRAMGDAGALPASLTGLFNRLVPDADRRRAIVRGAQDVTLEDTVLEQWAEFERNLGAYSDRRFVSDQYASELDTVQARADRAGGDPEDPPERLAAWVSSVNDQAIRELDLQLLEDLARLETEPGRARKVLDILRARAIDAARDDDWPGVARTVEAIGGVASHSAERKLRLAAAEILQALSRDALSERALAMLPAAEPELWGALSRVLAAIGAPLVPAMTALWASDRTPDVRARLEQVTVASAQGRDALRRLLSSEEGAGVRVAAIRLLRLTPGMDHLPALEAALSDPQEEVRAEAFGSLANAPSERAFDSLARGIARADASAQGALLTSLLALGDRWTVPVLRRLFPQVDPHAVPVPVYLSLIAAVQRAGQADAASLLATVFHRTRWSAPIRTWRVRAAARAALRGLRSRAATVPGETPPAVGRGATPAPSLEARRR